MSEERQETVADIVSVNHQFRDVAKMIPHEEVTVAEIQQPLQPVANCHGLNAAKMREALEEIRSRLVYLYGMTDGTFSPPALKEVYEIADTALSEPPMNCDRFDNIKEAKIRYCAEVEYVPIWDGFYSQRLIKWLFAKKKEEQK